MYFARSVAGALVNVTQVARGRNCDCRCLACESPLIARQGAFNAWHFAHDQGGDDRACAMTALHRAAQELLPGLERITLPSLQRHIARKDVLGREQLDEVSLQNIPFTIEGGVLEYRLGSRFIDVWLTGETGPLGVEIKVTHEVVTDKATELEARAEPVIEIDLSEYRDKPLDRKTLAHALEAEAPRFIIAGAEEIFAEHLLAAEHDLAKKLGRISATVKAVTQVSDAERERRREILVAHDFPSEPWPAWLDHEGWLKAQDDPIVGKIFDTHHSVWQAACVDYLFGQDERARLALDPIVAALAEKLGCAIEQGDVTARRAIRHYLGNVLTAQGLVYSRGNETYTPRPAPAIADKVQDFAASNPEAKAATVRRWLHNRDVTAPIIYAPPGSFTGRDVFGVDPSIWQLHAWLYWIHGRSGHRLYAEDFNDWVDARYPGKAERIVRRDALAGYLNWLFQEQVLQQDAWSFNQERPTYYTIASEYPKRSARSPVAPHLCPQCGGPAVQRRVHQGDNEGRAFWGCSDYPTCTGFAGWVE